MRTGWGSLLGLEEEQGGDALSPANLGSLQREPWPGGALPFSASPCLALRTWEAPDDKAGHSGAFAHPAMLAPSWGTSPFPEFCIWKAGS